MQLIKEIILETIFNTRPPGNSRQHICTYREDSRYTHEFMERGIVEGAHTQYSQNIWATIFIQLKEGIRFSFLVE